MFLLVHYLCHDAETTGRLSAGSPTTSTLQNSPSCDWSLDLVNRKRSIWSSEKILKMGRGLNFSLHVQGSPVDCGSTEATGPFTETYLHDAQVCIKRSIHVGFKVGCPRIPEIQGDEEEQWVNFSAASYPALPRDSAALN